MPLDTFTIRACSLSPQQPQQRDRQPVGAEEVRVQRPLDRVEVRGRAATRRSRCRCPRCSPARPAVPGSPRTSSAALSMLAGSATSSVSARTLAPVLAASSCAAALAFARIARAQQHLVARAPPAAARPPCRSPCWLRSPTPPRRRPLSLISLPFARPGLVHIARCDRRHPTVVRDARAIVSQKRLALSSRGRRRRGDHLASPPTVRVAVVDIGTNSTRLLIADVDPSSGAVEELLRRSQVTRLGDGVDAGGSLSEEAIARVLDDARRLPRRDRLPPLRGQPRRAHLGRARRLQRRRLRRARARGLRPRRPRAQRL